MRVLVLSFVLAVPALAGLGDGFGGGDTSAIPVPVEDSVTYPAVNVQVGGYVEVSPTVTGGSPSSYAVTSGALPDGLSLNSSTGAITGTVTAVALLANGRSTSIGKHVFSVTADLATDVVVPVAINVVGIKIPQPESLLIFSEAYKSGSNFTDANKGGTTWTLTNGTTDANCTDASSPTGYAHTFDGNTCFTDAGISTTKGQPMRATWAYNYLYEGNATATTQYYYYWWHSSVSSGTVFQSLVGGSAFAPAFSVTIAGTNQSARIVDTKWRSFVGTLSQGKGLSVNHDGRDGVFLNNNSLTFAAGTGRPSWGGACIDGVTKSNYVSGKMTEAAYWPRDISDANTIASIDWCWNRGTSLKTCDGTNAPTLTTTIDLTEPSTDKPVTYSGSYTLTGSATNVTDVKWRIGSGVETSCTGTTSWSCAITHTATSSSDAYVAVMVTVT